MLKVYWIMLKVEINNRILGVRFFEYISSRCKIASAQFCNKQITNTVSHNKKEQIPNGTCSFLVLGRDCVEAHFVIKHYHG